MSLHGRGSSLGNQLGLRPCQACTRLCRHTLHMQKHVVEPGRGCMDGLLLHHFQQFVIILCNDMPAIDVGVGISQDQSTLTDIHTQCSHSKSQHQ